MLPETLAADVSTRNQGEDRKERQEYVLEQLPLHEAQVALPADDGVDDSRNEDAEGREAYGTDEACGWEFMF